MSSSQLPRSAQQDPCDPICDFCQHYDFHPNAKGAYTGDGRCEHPGHPRPADPADACDDFVCATCGKGPRCYP